MIQRIAKLLWGRAEDAPTDRMQLGAGARRLLDDPILALAFDLVERELIATILNSAVADREQREAAYRLHWAKEQVRAKLRGMLANAKLIEAEAKRQEEAERLAAERRERYGT